ncbi:MAG TPA: SurA N-terminal domain-containing protein [Blastocatellia bacterium]|nr:SurA N-terminal domain-containing protein [Blastocatellia bacterium]
MNRVLILLVMVSVAAGAVRAQQIVDQILALVNNEIITKTDLLWSLALEPSAPSPAGEISSDILRRKLDVMIDERLVAQEAARLPGAEVSEEEIDRKRAQLIGRFKSEAEFRQRIESVGLTPERLDQLLRERILIDRFIEFRFKSFVFVSEDEIKRFYDNVIVPEVRAQGAVPPPIDKLREGIVERIRQEKINDEIDRWLIDARQRAEIVHLAEP